VSPFTDAFVIGEADTRVTVKDATITVAEPVDGTSAKTRRPNRPRAKHGPVTEGQVPTEMMREARRVCLSTQRIVVRSVNPPVVVCVNIHPDARVYSTKGGAA
jgi:hypothetical protein